MSIHLSILALLLSDAAFAQEMVEGSQADDEEIVITGRGLADSRGDAAYSVTVIDRDRIAESASGRLEDVLRDVAGQQSFRRSDSRSSNATNQSITLRGMGGNASSRAQLVLDGVPQGDPFGGWISFPAYSTDRLARIRVTRGGGSGLWGPGALSGTIEATSAGPGEAPPYFASLALGSRDSLDARAGLLVGDRKAFASLSGAFTRGDGFVPIIAGDRGPIDRPAPYRQYSLAARGVVTVGGNVEVQGNLSTFRDERERGLPNTANRGKGIDGSVRLVGRGPVDWSLLAYGQKREFANKAAAIDAARTTSTLVLDQFQVPSTGWGGRAEIVPLSGATELRVGVDLRAVKGETNELYQFVAGEPTRRREAGGRSLTAGAFADLTLSDGPLTANLAARLDRWSIRNGRLIEETVAGGALTDTAFRDRDGWQPTGRIGIAYRLEEALTLRAAAYRGWRLATLNELYRPFRAGADATAANAGLKPETSLGAEVGADLGLGGDWKASATLFTARLDDAIANVTVARGPGVFPGVGFVSAAGSFRRRENLDRIRTRGLELDVGGSFADFDLRLSYAYIDAKVRADGLGAPLDGKRPAQVPSHFVAAMLGWDGPRDLRASLTARGVSRQYEDDLNRRTLAGAITIDGYVRIPLVRKWSIEARAENLLDRTVEAVRSADDVVERAVPRTFWLGLRLN